MGSRLRARPTAVVAVALTIAAICVQIGVSRHDLLLQVKRSFRNIDHAVVLSPRSGLTRPFETDAYEKLQAAIPAGAPVAIMLDEPHYLDFKRNPIFNLDMPGYASLPPGQPFFLGSEPVAEYFRKIGVRYIAFVRSDASRYHYRREYWIERLAADEELWRTHAAYIIDFMDSLAELSRTYPVRFEERGMVVLDLEKHR